MLSARLLYLLQPCLLILLLYSGAAEAEQTETHPTEDDLIVVELRLGQQMLTDNLFLYQTDSALLLPLEELSNLLDFPITVNAIDNSAEGWYIQPERTFRLNLENGTVTLADNKQSLPDTHGIVSQHNDLYVPAGLLEQWFPLQLELNFSDLRLIVKSNEPLPLEQHLARKKKHQNLRPGTHTNQPQIRYLADRYRWASYPTLDANLESTYTGDNDQSSASTSLSATGDLLKHSAFLNYNYNSRSGSQNIRFNLSRYASTPDQKLPGGLFSYQLGDLYTTGDSLISNGGEGVGVTMSSSVLNRRSNYSSTVIEGDAPANWEAELYRNNSLLAFQTVSSDGIYRFEDVELSYGDNNFEVRLYGPQGQTRIERSSNYIGRNQLPPGQFNYAFYALDEENNRLFGDQADMSDRRSNRDIHAEWNLGVTDTWSTGLAWNQLARSENNEQVEHNYLSLSNDLSLNNAFLHSTFSLDSDGGNAALLSLRTRLAGQNINLEHRYFNDFVSEKNPLGSQLQHDTQLRLNGNFNADRFINYTLAAKQESFVTTADRYRLDSRLSTQIADVNVTHSQTASKTSGNANISLPGSFSASRHSTQGGVSATLNYNLSNDNNIVNSVSTNLRKNIDSRRHNLLQLSYEPGPEDSWSIKNSFTWKLDQANLTLRAETDDQDDWQVTAGVNFSTGYDALSQRPWISARPSSQSGILNTRVFWDKDNSGTFSAGDEPLSGVSLQGAGLNNQLKSDDMGRLQLRNLPTFRAVRLGVDEGTLEDPYWQLRSQPDHLYLHSGAQAELELPIVAVSEIEGYLFSGDSNGQYPIKSTRLLLVNDQGEVVATTMTEFDGLFLFDQVIPGNYQILPDQDYLRKKGLSVPTPQPIEANVDGGVLSVGTTVLYGRSVAYGQPSETGPAAASTEPASDWKSVKPRYISPALLKKQPEGLYAVQLLAGASALEIQQFTRRYNLTHTHFIRVRNGNQSRFILLRGIYPAEKHARRAISQLPVAVQQQSPQILQIGALQEQVKGTDKLTDNYPPHYPQRYKIFAASFTERLQSSRRWLEERATNGYTIQLMASYDPDDLEAYIQEHGLQSQGLIVKSQRNSRAWYLLLYGYHPDEKGINTLKAALPTTMTEFKPWVRPISEFQALQLANSDTH